VRRLRKIRVLCLCGVLAAVVALSQSRGWRRQRSYDRGNVPQWQLEPEFARDCFTFARIKYQSWTQRRSMTWDTDYPDSDVNLSFRLHQLTALRVHQEGKVIELTDPELFNFPFIFMSGVGGLVLDDEEAKALRRYLLSGGFLMVDDFWGEAEWSNFAGEFRKVFPDRKPLDLTLEHPIFHAVFDLKEKPQIPNIMIGMRYRDTGITWERDDAKEPHYRAIFDDRKRMMVMICHNTDLGDGWEEEGTDPYYFATFSEPKAYPLGINILFYAMTH
jgi:hypothetical protein